MHDLQIIPDEAKVIRLVFDYYIRYGYGGRRIATELAAQGIYDRNGEVFHPSSINAFLHRELFTGVMCRGGVRSQLNPELQIISPETFQKAQQVMEKRKQGQLPKNLEGRALLSGNVYRSYCEGRIFASTRESPFINATIGFSTVSDALHRALIKRSGSTKKCCVS